MEYLLRIKAIFDERLVNNWSNHDVAVKYAELANCAFVSYVTLKKHYDTLNKLAPILLTHSTKTNLPPVPTTNRFDSLTEQHDNVEIERIVDNPSIIHINSGLFINLYYI